MRASIASIKSIENYEEEKIEIFERFDLMAQWRPQWRPKWRPPWCPQWCPDKKSFGSLKSWNILRLKEAHRWSFLLKHQML